MNAVKKLQLIQSFLIKNESERFAPIISLIQSLTAEQLEMIQNKQSNIPSNLNKGSCQANKTYVQCDKDCIQVVRASCNNHLNAPAIETLQIKRKTNFFNPEILNYDVVADNLHQYYELRMQTISKDDVELSATTRNVCVAKTKPEEHALMAKNYYFQHQSFYDASKANDFNHVGSVYESKPSTTLHKLTHEAFNKLVGLKKEQTFDR